jgi:hypothetical protein
MHRGGLYLRSEISAQGGPALGRLVIEWTARL